MTTKRIAVVAFAMVVGTTQQAAADPACEEIRDVGTLELEVDPHRPERLVDIFWTDPESLPSHPFLWQAIAETLTSRYGCTEVTAKNLRKALVAAGDKCAAERTSVAKQQGKGAIKQGIEASWTPTRKLWKCEQRLARRIAEKAPPAAPLSKRDQCIADGFPPSACDAGDVIGPDWGSKPVRHF